MTAIFRSLLWKELYELVRQPWMLIGAFLIPLYILYVATTLVQPNAPVRVLVSYPPGELHALDWQFEDLSHIAGIDTVAVADTQGINQLMARHGATLGISLSQEERPTYFERSSTRFERRANFELATRVNRALGASDKWLTGAVAGYISDGGPQLDLRHLSVMPGPATQVFVPKFLALVTVFLATLLAARSMLREMESRTLPLLMTLPHGSWTLTISAKLAFVVVLTVTVMAFLLLTLQPVFGFYLRPDLTGIYGASLLAAFAAACVGTGLALLGNGTTQAYLAVSVG